MEQRGFRKTVVNNLNLTPGANQMNGQLQLGSAAETVTVTGSSASLETNSVEVSGSGGKLGVANRPHVGVGSGSGNGVTDSGGINGRNFVTLGALSPGAVENSIGGMEAAASGQGLGDLFEYKLKDRVTLKKNQSALVPIVQTELEAERVSLWSGITGSGRPLRGLWLKNTSSLTLDGGSFSVLDNEVFAGEGLTDPIKPGERRILSYATDLGLLVQADTNDRAQHVTRVKISKGVLTQIAELQQRTLYTVRNEDDTTRQLVVEHPARYSWALVKGSKQPEEKAPGVNRFRLEVPAKATATLPVEGAHIQETTYQLSDLNDDQIALFVRQFTLTPEMQQALAKITAQKAVVANLEAEMGNRQKDIERIVDDQGRLRENMKALRGSAEEKTLLQRYTRQLDEQETRLDGLRKKIEETEAQRDQANTVLEKLIADLQIDATL